MTKMTKKIRVADNLDDYAGFFNHQKSRIFHETVRPTKLSSAGFDLLTTWKGISEARRFPWLMIQAVNAAIDGAVNLTVPIPVRLLKELLGRIETGLENHHITLSQSDRAALAAEIESISSQLSQQAKGPSELNPNQLWYHFLQNQGIALSLLMSEVNAYAAVYFAYENYLIRCIKLTQKLDRLWPLELKKKLEGLLGQQMAEVCWTKKEIEIPRLIRHAIVHNGRKLTRELERYRRELTLEDEEVVIMAHHTTELYKLLDERALIALRKW